MNKNKGLTQYIFAGLLIAIALIIPLYFKFLSIQIPPFSATIASHVPTFIALMINPLVALLVGIGSSVGFLLAGSPTFVVARATSHILWGYIGAKMLQKKVPFGYMMLVTMLIHGIYEGLIIIPFFSNDIRFILITAFGTMIHHIVDGLISYSIAKPLGIAMKRNFVGGFFKNNSK